MKSNVAGWVLFAVVAPFGVMVGWGALLLACLFRMADWRSVRFQGTGVLTARWRPWFVARVPYSVTIGRAILYDPAFFDSAKIDNFIERHEFVHIRQTEDMMVLSLLVGVVVACVSTSWVDGPGPWILGLCLWVSGGAWPIVDRVGAVLRWGKSGLYRDAESERAAYAETGAR